MKKILLTVFIAFLLGRISVQASDWRYVGGGVYIDLESISKYTNSYLYPNNNMYTYWIKIIDDGTQQAKNLLDNESEYRKQTIPLIKVQSIMDCDHKKVVVVSAIYYKDDVSVSNSIFLKDYQYDWNSIVPDSLGEFYFKLICQPNGGTK